MLAYDCKDSPHRRSAVMRAILASLILAALTLCAGAQQVRLTEDEITALRSHIRKLWTPPADAAPVTLFIELDRDGILTSPPRIFSADPTRRIDIERALWAILKAQPFTMLRPESYEAWKMLEIRMDPLDFPVRGQSGQER